MICDITPEPFFGVGVWYADFSQTSDDEVRTLLAQSLEIAVKDRKRAERREHGGLLTRDFSRCQDERQTHGCKEWPHINA